MEAGKLPLAPEWHATNFCRFFELSIATLRALSASSSRIPHRDPHPPTRQDMPQVTVPFSVGCAAPLASKSGSLKR